MGDGPSSDEQLDRLAPGVLGWLARKLIHGLGWIIAGLGYVVAAGIFVGAYVIVAEVGGNGRFQRVLQAFHPFFALALAIAVLVALAWMVGLLAITVGSTITMVGARIADPHGKRSFGAFAKKPSIRYDGSVNFEARRLSTEGRARLEADAEPIRADREAREDERRIP
jgi:hypothetical protein